MTNRERTKRKIAKLKNEVIFAKKELESEQHRAGVLASQVTTQAEVAAGRLDAIARKNEEINRKDARIAELTQERDRVLSVVQAFTTFLNGTRSLSRS